MSEALVSVVVTTRNESKNIGRCLESIASQTWTNIETIVIDNASVDDTKEIARGFTTLVFDKGPERSAQRNYGLLEVATGEFGMFIDADMILTPRTVETCVRTIIATGSVALHVDEIVMGRGTLAAIRRFERSFYSGTVIDGVRFFRLTDFRRIGGFDETLPPGPEDWDLDKRFKEVGTLDLVTTGVPVEKWDFDDFVASRGTPRNPCFAGLFHNEDEQSLQRYLAKKSYYSPSMQTYTKKWGDDPDIRRQLGFKYRFFAVFVEQGKWRKLIRHPVKSIGMYQLRFLVGAQYLIRRNTRL